MNYFQVAIVSAFSIALPALVILARLPVLYKRYFPLLILFWTGLLNEITSYFVIVYHRNNMLNSNLYTLIEFLLFLWFFYRLNECRKTAYLVPAVAGIVIWIADNRILHSLSQDNTLFRMVSFVFIVYISMDKFTQLLLSGTNVPYRKTDLMLCVSFLVYYTYQAFILIFNIFPMAVSGEFYQRLWVILSLLNIVTNITYTIAILWIPKRMPYTLP